MNFEAALGDARVYLRNLLMPLGFVVSEWRTSIPMRTFSIGWEFRVGNLVYAQRLAIGDLEIAMARDTRAILRHLMLRFARESFHAIPEEHRRGPSIYPTLTDEATDGTQGSGH